VDIRRLAITLLSATAYSCRRFFSKEHAVSKRPVQNNPQTVTVLGARGMLGSDLVPVLEQQGYRVRGFDLPECDITRPRDLEQALEHADIVINAAAYTNVDAAEKNKATAMAVNAEAPGQLGKLAAAAGIRVVHISTDFVFDGQLDRPYREDDPPNPLGVYGASKLEGERRLLSSGCAGLVVRIQWTYGRAGNHFISKFLERARGQDELKMVADQTGSPTWTRDVATALTTLLPQAPVGLLHFAARGYATRFEIAREILALHGLKNKELRPCRTADFPAAAARPLNSRFDCTRIDALLPAPRPHWRDSLRTFLDAAAGRT
jgi:dTDP-4-dehydrorhamnose reductase